MTTGSLRIHARGLNAGLRSGDSRAATRAKTCETRPAIEVCACIRQRDVIRFGASGGASRHAIEIYCRLRAPASRRSEKWAVTEVGYRIMDART